MKNNTRNGKKEFPWKRAQARRIDCKYQAYRVGNLLWLTGDFPRDEAEMAGFTPAYIYPGSWLRQEPDEPLPKFMQKKFKPEGDPFRLVKHIRKNYGRLRAVNPEDKPILQQRGLLAADHRTGALTVDVAAKYMADEGVLPDGYPNTLLELLARAPGDVDIEGGYSAEVSGFESYREPAGAQTQAVQYADAF